MVRPIEIPMRDYVFLERFFADEPETWEEIKEDLGKLRGWAKMIKYAGWYDPDDAAKYEYWFWIENGEIKVERRKIS
ncbi:MAG: hypothetical protein AMQ22_00686 [Candidatus Methanofastidiosum methylothiophilum]|uniref:Uncharacterized protein n=1 Tax=Candidatus Methanofastidiosum methylothiophilum TaxID=1705564 RepID=A0A150J5Z2_9EURY|nr:MAG: hypothetical protein AMQ22_00686 [Candidatus Methanofastidiosum methylthiophilus]